MRAQDFSFVLIESGKLPCSMRLCRDVAISLNKIIKGGRRGSHETPGLGAYLQDKSEEFKNKLGLLYLTFNTHLVKEIINKNCCQNNEEIMLKYVQRIRSNF